MIGRYLPDLEEYITEKTEPAEAHGLPRCNVSVNCGDDFSKGSVYLTVTGTSAEAGDDGQVGRGNRVNGLITPCRPMCLEAAASKNPVSHVGKILAAAVQGTIGDLLIAAGNAHHCSRCRPAGIGLRPTMALLR
jgi:S-adenosylmethionine synthetase